MGLSRLLWVVLPLAVASCGSGPFGYKYYNLRPNERAELQGTLEAPNVKDNLDVSRDCADGPGPKEKNKCTVVLSEEAYRLKEEILQLRDRVKCLEQHTCQ